MQTISMGQRQSGSAQPGDVTLCGGEYMLITRIVAHPRHQHTDSPIRNDMTAVEFVTANGSRWMGVDEAHIGPDLRMHWTVVQ